MKHHQETDLRYLFEPQSVAIVGASAKPGKPGFNVVRNLSKWGFKGKIFPVNPNVSEILGIKTYPRVDSIPEEAETVIIATPAPTVPESNEGLCQEGKGAPVFPSSKGG